MNLNQSLEKKQKEILLKSQHELRLIGKPIGDPIILFQAENVTAYEQKTEIYPSLPLEGLTLEFPLFQANRRMKTKSHLSLQYQVRL